MSGSKKLGANCETTEFARERNNQIKSNDEQDKLINIINKHFQDELNYRESQFELIQQRLNDAQKAIHLLRYILITSYYNEHEKMSNILESQELKEGTSDSKKNRLHPAIKKLLGNTSDNYKFDFVRGKRKRTTQNVETKVKSEKEKDVKTEELTDLVEERTGFVKDDCEPFDNTRNRKKSKYHIVVGNISKTITPNSKEDKSTHKWMVYVRGSREKPDISHFVQKVVLYLHPSYSPNDVVPLKEPPFHLTRRGWGEFPLRVRIFFKNSLNKPVDIIHNLKLDTTFSGRQTLGNETLVDLKLYDMDMEKQQVIVKQELNTPSQTEEDERNKKRKLDNSIGDVYEVNKKIKIEKLEAFDDNITYHMENNVKQEIFQTEHDYCLSDFKVMSCVFEHNYSVPSNSTSTSNTNANLEGQPLNLIHGIENIEVESDVIEEPVLEEARIVMKKVPSETIVIASKSHESLLKNMFYKKGEKKFTQGISILRSKVKANGTATAVVKNCGIDYEKYKIVLPSHRFNNAYKCLFYLFKRLPIITELNADLNYRCTFPYTVKSFDEFSKWNIGKRLSSEWARAKTICGILSKSQLSFSGSLTTRDVIMYGRCYGFTPLASYKMCKNYKFPILEEVNGLHLDKNSTQRKLNQIKEPDVEIDIINFPTVKSESTNKEEKKLRLMDNDYNLACSYVKESALDVGVVLKSEEIIPGVLFNATERVLLQAGLCLAEDLIRKARSNRIVEGEFDETSSVLEVADIKNAISSKQHYKTLIEKYVNYRKHFL